MTHDFVLVPQNNPYRKFDMAICKNCGYKVAVWEGETVEAVMAHFENEWDCGIVAAKEVHQS